MKAKLIESQITELKENEIFVFGSNLAGMHGGGAAKTAIDKFGAVYGKSIGLQGNSYAIPTLDENLNKLSIDFIQQQVNVFENFVNQRQDLHFLITPIGTGIAGFSIQEMAVLFAGFQNYENVSLPKEFIDIIGENVIYGYKAMTAEYDGDLITRRHCREFDYEIGNVYSTKSISICEKGFHFCENIIDTLNYYNRKESTTYCKVIGCGQIQKEDNKVCVSIIKIVSEFATNDKTWNTGNWNTGYRNTGDRNTGNWNTGDRNTGNCNTGNWNTGNWNTGNWNTGFLNTTEQPLFIFNKLTDKKRGDIYFPNWMYFDLIIWKYSSELTDSEKKENPYHETTGGILIKKDYREAAQESYNKATKEEQRSIEDLPNYDAQILFEIFGIDRRK
jgi:hypothetical protein